MFNSFLFTCLLFFILFYVGCGGGSSNKPPTPGPQIIYSYALQENGNFLLLNDNITVLVFQD